MYICVCIKTNCMSVNAWKSVHRHTIYFKVINIYLLNRYHLLCFIQPILIYEICFKFFLYPSNYVYNQHNMAIFQYKLALLIINSNTNTTKILCKSSNYLKYY